MRSALLLQMVWLLATASVAPSVAWADDPRVWAVVQQEELPRLNARTESANARHDAREAFFTQSGPFAAAFPTFDGASLGELAVLRGRLSLLDDAAVARAKEAQGTIEAGDRQRAKWRAALDRALRAEEAADGLERRLLTGMLAGLDSYPELGSAAVAVSRRPLEEAKADALARAESSADEEAKAGMLRKVARADQDLMRFDEVIRQLRLASVGGRPPSPEPELRRLEAGPPGLQGAALRLRLMRPFLDRDLALQVVERTSAFWNERKVEAEADLATAQAELAALAEQTTWPALEAAQADVARAERVVARRQELEATVPARDAADEARLAVYQLRSQTASLRLEAAQEVLARAKTAVVDADTSAERALTKAQAAQQAADKARSEAAGALDRRIADALGDYADAQGRSAQMWGLARDAQAAEVSAQTEWADEMADLKRQVSKVQTQSALDPDPVDADVVFARVRALLTSLRDDDAVRGGAKVRMEYAVERSTTSMAGDRERLEEVATMAAGAQLAAERQAELLQTAESWEVVLEEEKKAGETLRGAVTNRRDIGLRTLHDARIARRTLTDYISRQARNDARAELLTDLTQEVSLLGPSVVMMVRGRLDDLLHASSFLTDFNVLRSLFMGSISTFVLVFAWWWARSQTHRLSLQAAQRVRKLRPELRLADVHALRDPTERFLRNAIDLALGYSLLWSLGDMLPELAFALLVYLQLSLYRVLLAGFDLAVVRNDEVRPALLALRLDAWRLARRTVQWFVGFFILRSFIRFVVWDALGLDTIHLLIEWLLGWCFWGLVGWALWQWQPHLRERAARYATGHKVIAWLAMEDGSPLLRIPRAVGALGFFGVRAVVDLAYRGARDGTSLGWLFNFVNRYRLEDDASEEVRFLPVETRQLICDGDTLEKNLIERVEVTEGVTVAINEWKRTRRRGLVAIVGDRGSGKGTSCNLVHKQLTGLNIDVHRIGLEQRLTGEKEGVRWLGEVTGAGLIDTVEELTAALEAMEPRGFIFEGIHRAFARKVGGLDAVAAILYVLNATSDQHFWVVSVHGPAWDWFDSVGSLVDTGVFRTVVRLAPLTSAQLKALTVARTGQHGLRVDFQGLVRASALGTDPKVELERSTSVFYRLLGEASSGNPTVAMRMWSKCLEPTEDDHVVTVRMGGSLSAGVVASLSDNALFVLVALRLQDELSVPELVVATNLSRAAVRSTVRDLVSRGLLERRDEQAVRIPDESLQPVSRTLRRRHFLHLGAA